MNCGRVFFILVTIFLLASCSMEKRRYMSGYHVEWSGNKFKTPAQTLRTQETADVFDPKSVSDSSLTITPGSPESPVLKECADSSEGHRSARSSANGSRKKDKPTTPGSGFGYSTKLSAPLAQLSLQGASTAGNVDVSGKHILAYIAFGFALATIVFMGIALLFSTGWAALGYIALAVLAMMGAALFSIISLVLFLKSEESIPWYEFFALIVGVIGIGIALRIWVFP